MISYHLISNTLVLAKDGKHYQITKSDNEKQFDQCVALIKENKLEEVIKMLDVQAKLEKFGFVIVDNQVQIDGEELPRLLSDKILQFHREGFPFQPLVKFWNNLKNNPSFRARKDLYSFLSHNGHPITEDGCFIAYRKISNDWKDLHTGTMDNSIGQVVKMDRKHCDDNPNNTCSSGLHFGAWEYVKDFGSGRIVEVKVNPANVVSIPTDYNNMKGRCCEFEVIAECDKPITNTSCVFDESDADSGYEEEYIDEECCDDCGCSYDDCSCNSDFDND